MTPSGAQVGLALVNAVASVLFVVYIEEDDWSAEPL